MTNAKIALLFLFFFGLSYSLPAQEKKKIFLANLQIGKSDINKEKQIEATLVESLRESVDVLTEREAYRYMTPQTKKKNPCNPQDILCTEKEIEPLIKSTQKCLALKSYSPEYCYLPYLKKFDLSSLLIQDIQQNPKELQIKLVLFTYSSDLFERENLFEKNILPFQLNFYLKEIPKFLLNPKYIIQVPKELYYSNEKIDLSGMRIEPFYKLDIEIYQFATGDNGIDKLIEEQKSILRQADDLFLKSEYARAKNFYSGIIKAIEIGLRPIGLSKVSPYLLGLKSRIGLCEANEFIFTIHQTDAKVNQGEKTLPLEEWIDVMKEYFSLYQKIGNFEALDKKTEEKIRSGLVKRIDLLKAPVFTGWEKRAEQLFYQFKFLKAIEEYDNMIATLGIVFPLEKDQAFYKNRYEKSTEDVKIKGKINLREFIKSRALMAERKNINYISQYYIENEKVNDIKIYQIISDNILDDLILVLKDSDYDDYLTNGIKKAYNRVVFQINQSRKNLSDPYFGEYAPYFPHTSKMNLEFAYIPGFETLKDCETSDSNCFTDYNGVRKKVYTQKSFYMSKTEITQDQWMQIMDLYNYGKDKKFKNKEENLKSTNNPSFFKECGPNCPVESISYEDVLKFIKVLCKKEGYANGCPYRLPTQKEWESSAAGWNKDTYPGVTGIEGNTESALSKIAHYGKNCTVSYEGSIALNELGDQGSFNPIKKIGKLLSNFDTSFLEREGEISNLETYFQGAASKCGTLEVGKKENNFFSLSDLAGNVAEFCEKTPKGLGVCGGSWASMNEKKELISSSFLKVSNTLKHPTIGFRLIYAPREP